MRTITQDGVVVGDAEARERTGSQVFATGLKTVLATLNKRRLVLFGCIAAMLALGVAVTLMMKPKYTAYTSIEIKRENQNLTNVRSDAADKGVMDPEFYETQYGLLRSQSLADAVAQDLRLHDSAKFFASFGSRKAKTWFENDRVKPGASTSAQRAREAGGILLNNVGIDAPRLSRLVTIRFTGPDPALAQRVANSWSQHFIQATLERKFDTTAYARKFLENRLAQLRTRIDQSERQLVAYAASQGIVNLPAERAAGSGNATSGERSLLVDDLATLNQQLNQATADRIQAQSRLNAVGGQTSEALSNQAISTIRSSRAELAAQYAKLLEQFEPEYPAARALDAQIKSLDRQLGREEGRVRSTLQDTYTASAAREAQLQSRVEGLKTGLFDLRRRSVQYNVYEREVDTNRQLYDALLQRYKEIGVAGGVGANNISIVDPAQLPERPSSPRLMLNLLIALLLGTALGVGAALLLEQFDDAISDPSEVQNRLHQPLLGTIPAVKSDPREDLRDPKTALSEAYFSLHTNLSFSTDHGLPKVLAVTSSNAAEGKSLTTYALAKIVAATGRQVILIDADMRSPSVHHNFGLSGDRGLSNILTGDDDLTTYIQSTEFKGLSVIAAGRSPPSAAELLASERLDRLIARLLESYDCVMIDSPPVMGLADALLVGSRAERMIFVVEAHATGKSVARVALDRLLAADISLLGVVMTKFNSKRAGAYGYGYGYSYSYGAEPARGA